MRGRTNIQILLIAIFMLLMPHILKAENLIEYFNIFNSYPVTIKNCYAQLNFIGGFADGKYNLKNYSITPYTRNIYILKINLYKKKHHFSYTYSVTLPFYINKNIIAFKTIKGRLIYHFPSESFFIKKVKNGYIATAINPGISVRIPLENGFLYLNIEKN